MSKLATFTLTDRASAAYAIVAGAGTSQEAQLGTDFAIPLAVTVTDSSGNDVAGAKVTFTGPAAEPAGCSPGTVRQRWSPPAPRVWRWRPPSLPTKWQAAT